MKPNDRDGAITVGDEQDASGVRHTPGPWTVGTGGQSIGDITGRTLALNEPFDEHGKLVTLRTMQRRCNHEELPAQSQANARLMAAAPDLLAALRGLFEHCAMMHKHWGDGSNQRQADEAITAARAAMAKAEGEELSVAGIRVKKADVMPDNMAAMGTESGKPVVFAVGAPQP